MIMWIPPGKGGEARELAAVVDLDIIVHKALHYLEHLQELSTIEIMTESFLR